MLMLVIDRHPSCRAGIDYEHEHEHDDDKEQEQEDNGTCTPGATGHYCCPPNFGGFAGVAQW
jgi:hypothetical protein